MQYFINRDQIYNTGGISPEKKTPREAPCSVTMTLFWQQQGIFDTHIIQVAAYAKALEEQLLAMGNPREKAEVKEAYVVRFSKFDNEYEVKRVANIDESFNAFKACLFLWHYKQKNQMESV